MTPGARYATIALGQAVTLEPGIGHEYVLTLLPAHVHVLEGKQARIDVRNERVVREITRETYAEADAYAVILTAPGVYRFRWDALQHVWLFAICPLDATEWLP